MGNLTSKEFEAFFSNLIFLNDSDFLPLLCFQVGDRIVSINGQPLDGLSHADVVNLLKNAYGRIILQVLHQWTTQLREADKWRAKQIELHWQ